MKALNFLVAGVGGQGTLLASDILAEVGMRAGYDAKKSDVLGLAVRGGSVLSHVRWGENVLSPVVRQGGMDYMVAFEPLEAMRGLPYLHGGSVVLVNSQSVPPVSVSSGTWPYPSLESMVGSLREHSATCCVIDATKTAVNIGTAKVSNVVLLGAFSALLGSVPVETWREAILERVPEKFVEVNRQAFDTGRSLLNKESNG